MSSTIRILALVILATFGDPPASSLQKTIVNKPCGTERWAVKTLSDKGAGSVRRDAKDEKISSLTGFPRPIAGNAAPKNRLSPLEFQTYRVPAIVIAFKLEADRDFHIVVADPENPQKTMIVEIPDPQCDGAKGSRYAQEYQSARAMFINLVGVPQRTLRKPGRDIRVKIEGVAFFDVKRQQTGAAPNGIELHPVLKIERY